MEVSERLVGSPAFKGGQERAPAAIRRSYLGASAVFVRNRSAVFVARGSYSGSHSPPTRIGALLLLRWLSWRSMRSGAEVLRWLKSCWCIG